jgi:uncharacterized OsmC-like protein
MKATGTLTVRDQDGDDVAGCLPYEHMLTASESLVSHTVESHPRLRLTTKQGAVSMEEVRQRTATYVVTEVGRHVNVHVDADEANVSDVLWHK